MTGSRWRMQGLTFTIALEALGRDRLPYPLSYIPDPTEFPDLDRSRAAAAERLRARLDDHLYHALTVLLEPEYRIEVYGFHGPEQTATVRIHAGISGELATLAVQAPGPTRRYGTEVTISTLPAIRVGQAIVALLPRVTAGSLRPVRGQRSDLDTPADGTASRTHESAELRRFFRRPRIGTGEISVVRGAAIDSRYSAGRGFLWLDYPDDGRYLLTDMGSDHIVAVPGTPRAIIRRIGASW
ncbi:ESX secretion-associated protein EspG [Nocardia asteroides]|uniref:ESX secretion-associated protein EspG n=1 Tax=Nocardia asteroides TaxID=1824 RepID=UPI00343D83E2